MNGRSADDLATDLLGKKLAELSPLERDVIDRIATRKVTTGHHDKPQEMGFGARLADRVAAVGGSWGFISSFGIVLFGWMLINSPMLAAIQAPIIMMSQNRQGEKDRIAAKHDYQVNLRAELEIILLHEKLEHMMGELDQIKVMKKS